MSTGRAKKKRRQRARAAGETSAGAGDGATAARTAGAGERDAKAARTAGAGERDAKAARTAGAGERDAKAARTAGAGERGAKAARAGGAGGRGEARETPSRMEVRDGVAAPKPVWAPFPLTEIGMAAGIAIFGAGFLSSSTRTLAIGAIVLAVVTAELCLREHFAGFRSHTLLLAALPVAILHGAVVVAISDAYRGPLTLAVDLAAGGALAWWLRERFRLARARNRTP